MIRRLGMWFAAVLVLLVACAQDGAPALQPQAGAESEATADLQIVLDPRAEGLGSSVLEAWMAYGLQKLATIQERSSGGRDLRLADYPIELAARRTLAEFWQELKQKEEVSDPYLDKLLEVRRDGYLEEYVLAAFGRPGWTIPPAVLQDFDVRGFRRWARKNLAGHEIPTLARVRSSSRLSAPAVPGDWLPDLDSIATDAHRCERLPQGARSVLARWEKEAASLDGTPLAAETWAELAEGLERMRDLPRVQERGVTWVSMKPAALSFLIGFCEVEHQRFASGLEPIERAIRVYPLAVAWHLELANALTVVKRYDEADRAIATAIELTDDPCLLAAAWRRRGYLLIDRGELQGAHQAYSTALRYDPQSELAKSELRLIEQEIAKSRGNVSKSYVPPPMGGQTLLHCGGD